MGTPRIRQLNSLRLRKLKGWIQEEVPVTGRSVLCAVPRFAHRVRPNSVVDVIGAAAIDVSCLLAASFGIYGIRYLRVIGCFSTAASRCLSALPGRLGRVKFIRWPRSGGVETSAFINAIRPLETQLI